MPPRGAGRRDAGRMLQAIATADPRPTAAARVPRSFRDAQRERQWRDPVEQWMGERVHSLCWGVRAGGDRERHLERLLRTLRLGRFLEPHLRIEAERGTFYRRHV